MMDETFAFRVNSASGLVEPVAVDDDPASFWVIDEEKTQDGWLEVVHPKGWYSAIVRDDGCIHFYRYHNVPITDPEHDDDELTDYLHICDIDEEIRRLQALKTMARRQFGDWWGE
jgi:hypothetical protein